MFFLIILLSFFLSNFNFFLTLQTESIVLFFSFFSMFFYYLTSNRLDSLFNVEEEEISFINELDWYIAIYFFIKIKNWYRFFYRYIYIKLNSFYKFLIVLKNYVMYWFSSIYNLLIIHFNNLNSSFVLHRLNSLEKSKKTFKYKNNPFVFLSL
ncbi:Orf145 (mitochondrion) [Naegleria fowleri]|uniref:Orf145 n=1 Tax=Naegleria fowleri TaxID=5763 RepID=M4H662_NAEFO|nr:Orf145 [Naegleria fowleri]AFP72308.1 Orf145 [Naegleria fowleri]AOS85635.1 orf145 [Naegleria fowleri]AOS85681.1 orf145 [Naegleria fowleri]UAT97076.1 hypothetical protein [Naegleria fowleri]WND64446.1 hypothetical protein HHPHBPLO_00026 [Naegleria fowleri]